MSRIEKYNYILASLQSSKLSAVTSGFDIVSMKAVEAQAGHFKLNSVFAEHALMLLVLSGQLSKIKMFEHGKKLKNTVLLQADITNKNK